MMGTAFFETAKKEGNDKGKSADKRKEKEKFGSKLGELHSGLQKYTERKGQLPSGLQKKQDTAGQLNNGLQNGGKRLESRANTKKPSKQNF